MTKSASKTKLVMRNTEFGAVSISDASIVEGDNIEAMSWVSSRDALYAPPCNRHPASDRLLCPVYPQDADLGPALSQTLEVLDRTVGTAPIGGSVADRVG
jgi:hypothetical protein